MQRRGCSGFIVQARSEYWTPVEMREYRSGFSRKAADVVGLCSNPLENALVLYVDESPAFKLWSGPRKDPLPQAGR
jgi:hypothetical protein